MKNVIKLLALCFFAIGMTIFTSCGSDDETMDVDMTLCDSLTTQINVSYDSLATILTAETFNLPGSFTYLWSTGETTASISVTDNGTYSVTVTATFDGETCTAEATVDLTNPVDCSGFTSAINAFVDSSGNNTTTLSVNLNGGVAPYAYLWSTGETTASIDITAEGIYGVSVTDANGCITGASYEYIINNTNPCDNFTAGIVEVDSFGLIELYATTSNGAGPFTFQWSTGEVTHVIVAPASGTYSVTVTDTNGCTATVSYNLVLNNPCANYGITFYFHPDSIQTGQDFLTAAPFGGTGASSYLWSTGETSNIIDVSGATGTYSVTTTDSVGCTAEGDYEF